MWITSSAIFLDRSNKFGSSLVIIMTSQKNLSIDTSFDMIYNARVPASTTVVKYGRYYYLGNKCLCGDHGFIASHNVSIRRSLPRYIYASLIVVYSYGASVVSN